MDPIASERSNVLFDSIVPKKNTGENNGAK